MKLLLLNGHPGSGKTTIAHELRAHVPRLAILDVDLFRKFISDYNNSPKDLALMWSVTQALIETYLSNNISVLVDRCVDDERPLRLLKTLAKKHHADFQEVVLYTKTLTCAVDRVVNRPQKQLSKFRKSKIDQKHIATLWKIAKTKANTKEVLAFDTQTVPIPEIVLQISTLFHER